MPVDPGERRFRFEHASHPAIERSVVVTEGEKLRAIDVEFDVAPTPSTPEPPIWPVAVQNCIAQ